MLFVQDIPPSQSPATFKHALRIANGVIGVFGVYAVNLVEMESSLGLDTYKDQQSMEERNVLDLPENQEIVLEIIAQLIVSGTILENGVLVARTAVVDGKDDLEH